MLIPVAETIAQAQGMPKRSTLAFECALVAEIETMIDRPEEGERRER